MGERWTLTQRAEGDLADIWRFGVRKWSIEQADRYQDAILDVLDMLGRHPGIAPRRDHLLPGLRAFPHASHVIFYRATDPDRGGIEILRIGHGRQDWSALIR
ncbi:type II toxin-antitoxin system RelE/ParE family toxin [Jannaschia aquimarina]|uniref:Toxin n=1 Tax=Jannaschia aquimarina TaxID=935700 RepID=A0A0D1D5V3_9RHOB|nr:type II toxin-antitoxin system RelE/ParE family toxin [Jannaschia aquimarina]KIT15328.1 Toxin ParE1 [Jannaschia aquimarina]SNS51358.1 toxin ParE1/3/4 [Jannaschia aquimarina]